MQQQTYDPLDPPYFKCPTLMSTFIILQNAAEVCRENHEEDLALLADLRIEGIVREGEWPKC